MSASVTACDDPKSGLKGLADRMADCTVGGRGTTACFQAAMCAAMAQLRSSDTAGASCQTAL